MASRQVAKRLHRKNYRAILREAGIFRSIPAIDVSYSFESLIRRDCNSAPECADGRASASDGLSEAKPITGVAMRKGCLIDLLRSTHPTFPVPGVSSLGSAGAIRISGRLPGTLCLDKDSQAKIECCLRIEAMRATPKEWAYGAASVPRAQDSMIDGVSRDNYRHKVKCDSHGHARQTL